MPDMEHESVDPTEHVDVPATAEDTEVAVSETGSETDPVADLSLGGSAMDRIAAHYADRPHRAFVRLRAHTAELVAAQRVARRAAGGAALEGSKGTFAERFAARRAERTQPDASETEEN